MALNILSIIASFLCVFSVSKAAILWSRDGQPFSSTYVYTPGFYQGFQINSTDYISKVADDIIIPSGENWSIENIYCGGGVSQAGTLSRIGNWTVQIVLNDGIRPSDDVVVSRIFPQTTTASPTFTFNPPVLLEGGGITYWVIVIPNFNFNTDPDDYYWVWLSLNGPVLGNPGRFLENPRFLIPPSQEPNTWYSTVYDHIFTVNGIRVDTQPPTCVNLFAGPSEIDFNTKTSQALNFTLLVDDNLGFDYGILMVTGPTGTLYNVRFDSTNRRAGTNATNGIYTTAEFILDRSHPGGSYELTSLQLFDAGGNSLNLTTTGMINQCFLSTTSINVIAYIAPTTSTSSSNAQDNNNNNNTDDGSNTGAIIGGVVGAIGGVIVIAIIVALIFFFVIRKKKSDDEESKPPSVQMTIVPEKTNSTQTQSQSPPHSNQSIPAQEGNQGTHYNVIPIAPQEYKPQTSTPRDTSFEIDYSELEIEKEIGRGAFGVVFKGRWRGGAVAIKQLINLEYMSEKEMQDFRVEAGVMKNLRPHVNVVQFLGITAHPHPLCIVTEFLDQGSLYSFLQSNAKIDPNMMMNIIKGIAAGMLHLHREGIIHRDLAARNILLGAGFQVKISDFGMSRQTETKQGNKTKSETGPLKWMSPEAIRNRIYSQASDVWSFGVTVWEIVTRQEPYPDLDAVQAALAVTASHLRLPIPEYCPTILTQIMTSCFQDEPEQRPDFGVICKHLQTARLDEWVQPSGVEQTQQQQQQPEPSLSSSTSSQGQQVDHYAAIQSNQDNRDQQVTGQHYDNF